VKSDSRETIQTMATPKPKRKPKPIPGTGLVYGQASTIARIHRVTAQHVIECARGNRKVDEKLARTINDYRHRNQASAPAGAAA
jgi:hypothetical protein